MNEYKSLDLNRVREALHGAAVGHTIDYHPTIDSTMPRAMELARNPATKSGTVVLTEEQLAGQGRRGRSWSAPFASSLLFSVIFVGPTATQVAATLSILAGVAVADAISDECPTLRDRLRLKWPNDVVVLKDESTSDDRQDDSADDGYGYKKVGGILAQVDYHGSESASGCRGDWVER